MKSIQQNTHFRWHKSAPVLLGLLALSLPCQAQPEINANTQKNVEKIQDYYDNVQQKLNNAGAQAANRPVKTQPPGQIKPPIPASIAAESLLAAPISGASDNPAAAYTPAGRDPFAVTPIMLENEHFTLKQEIDFTPMQGDFKVPSMRLKGVITGAKKNDSLAALLEIDGLGVFVVREGDSVGLQGIGNGRDVIMIESISRLSLVVRTGAYGGTSEKRFVVR